MRLFKLVFAFTLVFSLASCSSDDSDGPSTSGDLLGVWIADDVNYSGSTVTEAQGQTLTADFVGEAYDVDFTLTITENPNNIVSDGSYSIELTTTVLGQSSTQDVTGIEFLETGTWSRDGNQLTITANGESSVGTIAELTDSTLVIEVDQVEDLSEQGISIESTINSVVTFTRQ